MEKQRGVVNTLLACAISAACGSVGQAVQAQPVAQTNTSEYVQTYGTNGGGSAATGNTGFSTQVKSTSASRVSLGNDNDSTPALSPGQVVLQQGAFVSDGAQRDTFLQALEIKPSQEVLQMSLQLFNGDRRHKGFAEMQISSPGQKAKTAADFVDGALTIPLPQVSWGTHQLTVLAHGEQDAVLQWRLVASEPKATRLVPASGLQNDAITLEGVNLSTDLTAESLTIGSQSVPIVGASDHTVSFKIPRDISPGKHSVHLTVGGLDAGSLDLTVRAYPTIESISSTQITPSCTITLFGNGFSANLADNNVMVGPYQCKIVAASPRYLICQVPDFSNVGMAQGGFLATTFQAKAGWVLPITVTVNGAQAHSQVSLLATMD